MGVIFECVFAGIGDDENPSSLEGVGEEKTEMEESSTTQNLGQRYGCLSLPHLPLHPCTCLQHQSLAPVGTHPWWRKASYIFHVRPKASLHPRAVRNNVDTR